MRPQHQSILCFTRYQAENLGASLVRAKLIAGFQIVEESLGRDTWTNYRILMPSKVEPKHMVTIRAFAQGFGWGCTAENHAVRISADPRDARSQNLKLEAMIISRNRSFDKALATPIDLVAWEAEFKTVRTSVAQSKPLQQQTLDAWRDLITFETPPHVAKWYDELEAEIQKPLPPFPRILGYKEKPGPTNLTKPIGQPTKGTE